MRIFTSCLSTATGPGRIAITTGQARGAPAGFRYYRPLAPGWPLVRAGLSREAFDAAYRAEVLDRLDPAQVVAELVALARSTGATDRLVLLCFERPPFGPGRPHCHRLTVGAWLDAAGFGPVDELPREAREMFYIDENGRPTDVGLFDDMLEAGDARMAQAARDEAQRLEYARQRFTDPGFLSGPPLEVAPLDPAEDPRKIATADYCRRKGISLEQRKRLWGF